MDPEISRPQRAAPAPSPWRSAGRVARDVLRAALGDRIMMVAGGLAFFGLFGLFPALAAAALMLGGALEEETLRRALQSLYGLAPAQALQLVADFLEHAREGLGVGPGLALNLAIVVWCVQRSASGLITALNVAYDETEKRGRLRREMVAFAAAGGAVVLLLAAILVMAWVPFAASRLEGAGAEILRLARWPALALLAALALDVLYAYAPSRAGKRWKFPSWGAVVATLIWLAASAGFAYYMGSVGDWGPFYGSLTAAVVLLTWLFITALAVLLGAELNAQLAARREWRQEPLKHELEKREHADRG